MRKFLVGLLIFMSIPACLFVAIAALYLKADVYHDFNKRDDYSWKYRFQELGDLSTKKLLQSKTQYNSFVFGSSRSVSVFACYLQRKIPGSRFFHYANWNEPIGGIYAKLNLLASRGYRLDNVFIYFDTDFTFRDDGHCSPFDHYLLTNENKYRYYYHHFRGFLSSINMDELKILVGAKVSGEIFPNWQGDPNTNDGQHICTDSILNTYADIDRSPEYVHRIDSMKASGFLYTRSAKEQFKEAQISPYEEGELKKIKEILEKQHSKYYIAITPLYDQLKFHPSDMQILKGLFGDHLYDFSGINAFTNDPYNYPDRKHFLPYISKAIIDSIVTGK